MRHAKVRWESWLKRWALLVMVVFAPAAMGAHYYVTVFGFQNGINLPSASHSFATFVQTDDTPMRNVLTVHTISWMPRDLRFTVFSHAEPGINLDLGQSLWLASSRGRQAVPIGPYEISADLFNRSVAQYYRLENAEQTGMIRYRSGDGASRQGLWYGQWGGAINCIHALTDIVGYARTGALRGVSASSAVMSLYWPWVVDGRPQVWLLSRLGVY